MATAAAETGWAASDDGERLAPSAGDVSWELFDVCRVWEVCGLAAFEGTWLDRRLVLSEAGESAALSWLRHTATGPRTSID